MSDVIRTELPSEVRLPALDYDMKVLQSLKRVLNDWKAARTGLELHWKECWALYFGTPNANDWLRSRAIYESVGDVGADWRHHINQGKAYDLVETAIPYFKGASFPNEDWFDIIPCIPMPGEDVSMLLRILKEFIKVKLGEAKFKNRWEGFLRQLCILGTSCISLPWRVEAKKQTRTILSRGVRGDELIDIDVDVVVQNCPDMVVEDMFDIWLDPDGDDPNKSAMIRRFTLRRGELARLVKDGVYPKAKQSDVKAIRATRRGASEERNEVDSFYGVDENVSTTDIIEVYEFWGNLELPDEELYDVVITWVGDVLLRIEPNPYLGGRPFVFGQYTPIPKSPYGWGLLSPVMGNIHELNILSNCRLDGLEVTLQPTFLVQNDGTVDPDDIYVKPGRVIPCANPDGIRPLIQNNEFAAVSIQEEQLREQQVERRTGTGSFVGTAPGRSGERVTAAEVEATQSAGGNRLSGVYESIERDSLLEIVQRTYNYAQQFQAYTEIVPIRSQNDSREIMYAEVGMHQLAYDMKVQPIGAKHIANKEYNIRQMMDWLAAINSTPQLVQYVKWQEVATELTRQFIENNPDRFIMNSEDVQSQQQAMMGAVNPMQPALDQAKTAGGQELADATQAQMMADGGMNMAAGIGENMPRQPMMMSPEQQQLAQQAALYAGQQQQPQ